MSALYSNNLRQKVIEAYKSEENSSAELSKRFNVSIDAIARGLKLITADDALAWVQHAGYLRNQI